MLPSLKRPSTSPNSPAKTNAEEKKRLPPLISLFSKTFKKNERPSEITQQIRLSSIVDSHSRPQLNKVESNKTVNTFTLFAENKTKVSETLTYQERTQKLLSELPFNHILFVAEDTLLVTKMLRQKIIKIAKNNDPNISADQLLLLHAESASWGTEGMAYEIIGSQVIVYAGNGAIVLHVMQLLPADITTVLLTDNSMPLMQGIELIKAAMSLGKNTPIAMALHTSDTLEEIPHLADYRRQWTQLCCMVKKQDDIKIAPFIASHCFTAHANSKLVTAPELSNSTTDTEATSITLRCTG